MNRTDRMYAIQEELRRRGSGGSSAARLAELLEVSVRTIKRDVSALQQAGAPIWSQAGPGGGYTIAGSVNLPALNFSASQAVAASIALAALPAGSPFAVDARIAADKISDALDEMATGQASDLAARVWVDRADADAEPTNPSVVRAVETALSQQVAISLSVNSASREPADQLIEPMIVAWTKGRWYLVGYSPQNEEIRWIPLHRIRQANITQRRYEPRDVGDIGTPPATASSVDRFQR